MTQLVSVPTQADSAPAELRRSTRVRLQTSGRVVLMDYSEARSILVQDLSVHGACLKVGDWADLPNRFHLLLRRTPSEPHFQVGCTVRWLCHQLFKSRRGWRFQTLLKGFPECVAQWICACVLFRVLCARNRLSLFLHICVPKPAQLL